MLNVSWLELGNLKTNQPIHYILTCKYMQTANLVQCIYCLHGSAGCCVLAPYLEYVACKLNYLLPYLETDTMQTINAT